VVFSESQVPHGFAASGPHGTWNNGFLWDVLEMAHAISVQLQQKGWNGANHLAWNVETTSNLNFERPATIHQWIQGCIGPASAPSGPRSTAAQYGARPPEVISWNTRLEPASLYRAQLAERVGAEQALAVLGRPDGAHHFVLNTAPPAQMLPAGQTNLFALQMLVAPDYPGTNVTFSAVGLPPGVSASFNPPVLSGDGTTIVTLTASNSTPVGTYNVKLVGTGTFRKFHGGTHVLAHPAFIQLTVTNSVPFSIEAAPATQSVPSGGTALFDLNVIELTNGFSETVTFSADGLPDGATAEFDPPSVNGNGSTTLTITTATNTPQGDHSLTLVGTTTSGAVGVSVSLTVQPPPDFSLPSPWQHADLGAPLHPGGAAYSNGVFIVQGGGTNIAGNLDEAHFVYQTHSGDVSIRARVLSQDNTGGGLAQSGVMIRNSTNANAAFAAVVITPSNGVFFAYRSADGGQRLPAPSRRPRCAR
jgi:hypothetical protein